MNFFFSLGCGAPHRKKKKNLGLPLHGRGIRQVQNLSATRLSLCYLIFFNLTSNIFTIIPRNFISCKWTHPHFYKNISQEFEFLFSFSMTLDIVIFFIFLIIVKLILSLDSPVVVVRKASLSCTKALSIIILTIKLVSHHAEKAPSSNFSSYSWNSILSKLFSVARVISPWRKPFRVGFFCPNPWMRRF